MSLKILFLYLPEPGHMLMHLTNIKLSVMYKLKRTSCAVHHWNLLPDECRGIPTSALFRSAIMEYLWSLVKKRCNELNNDTSPIEREPD